MKITVEYIRLFSILIFTLCLSCCSSTRKYDVVSSSINDKSKTIKMVFSAKCQFADPAIGKTESDVHIEVTGRYNWDKQCNPYIIDGTFKTKIKQQIATTKNIPSTEKNHALRKIQDKATELHEADHKRRIEGDMPYVVFRNTKYFEELLILFEGAAVNASTKNLLESFNNSWAYKIELGAFSNDAVIEKLHSKESIKNGSKKVALYWDACLKYRKMGKGKMMEVYNKHVQEVNNQFKKELVKWIKSNGRCKEGGKVSNVYTWEDGVKLLKSIKESISLLEPLKSTSNDFKSLNKRTVVNKQVQQEQKFCTCGKPIGHLSNCN